MNLNKAQTQAIEHFKGPAMVLAGPGSGKTTVITQRIYYLTERCGVCPANILVITFTKAAAAEMKARYEKLCPGSAGRVSFGTFHAVFFKILKHAYGFTAQNIVRDDQRMSYIRELLEKEHLEAEDERELAEQVLGEISQVKGDMLGLEHYYGKCCSEQTFKRLYDGYEKRLRRAGQLDFDDMLVMCHQLFSQRPDILKLWQQKYQYILIDEFQDINRVQYEVIRMLAKPEDNLFIVGDDDQSIYRFRGAKPEIMLGFESDYPQMIKILLNINYRSTIEIVTAACRLIQHNRIRFPKQIQAYDSRHGRPVVTRAWDTAREETQMIAQEIRDYHAAGYGWNDMAVLYRTNLGPRLLMERLMEYNIPFCTKESVPNQYEHWAVKHVLAYIRMAQGDLSRRWVLSVINRPNRYVSRDALAEGTVCWEAVKTFYLDKLWMIERIEQLEYDLSMIKGMAPAAAVNYIRKGIGYDQYVRDYAQERNMNAQELQELMDQLQESASGFKTVQNWFHHMEEYGKELREQSRNQELKTDALSLMTMHGSKGLEYKIVYVLDANEGVTPHQKAVLDADMEEERRMFYVAMTRAKERLHIYFVKERHGKPQSASRFVSEYLEEKG